MAVHVPLSVEAQNGSAHVDARAKQHFLPSSGKPITTPSQDITLGCYYLTQNPRRATGTAVESRLPLFADAIEVEFAMAMRDHDGSESESVGVRLGHGDSTSIASAKSGSRDSTAVPVARRGFCVR